VQIDACGGINCFCGVELELRVKLTVLELELTDLTPAREAFLLLCCFKNNLYLLKLRSKVSCITLMHQRLHILITPCLSVF
jgi:hypothetical protein